MRNIKFNKTGAVLGLFWGGMLLAIWYALIVPAMPALGASFTYVTRSGDTLQSVAAANGTSTQALIALNPSIALQKGQTLKVGIPTVTPPPVVPPVVPPTSGEVRFTGYNTLYGYPDNTPANSAAISNPVIHSVAGGTGTYADPITLAVGHSIINGVDILDYPAGTKFYIPAYRRYFIAEDTCGDGNTPQNGACHKDIDHPGIVQLDLWIGGVGQSANATINCEDALTGLHLIIENPASNYAVVPGQIFNGSCPALFGDAVVTQ